MLAVSISAIVCPPVGMPLLGAMVVTEEIGMLTTGKHIISGRELNKMEIGVNSALNVLVVWEIIIQKSMQKGDVINTLLGLKH